MVSVGVLLVSVGVKSLSPIVSHPSDHLTSLPTLHRTVTLPPRNFDGTFFVTRGGDVFTLEDIEAEMKSKKENIAVSSSSSSDGPDLVETAIAFNVNHGL